MMKEIVLSILFLLVGIVLFGQTEGRRFAVGISLGGGIALDRPSKTPFTWQIKGYYEITSRLFAGVGTGISVYEKTLIPVFGEVKYMLVPVSFCLMRRVEVDTLLLWIKSMLMAGSI